MPESKNNSSRKQTDAKKTTTKKAIIKNDIAEPTTSKEITSPEIINSSKKKFMILLGLLLIFALLYYFKSFFIVSIVNGQPITRMEFNQELEKEAGKQAIDVLTKKTLILQEAQKQHVSVSNDDLNAELKKADDTLKKQGSSLTQLLSMRNISKKDFMEQIRIQKLIEKMLAKNVMVTDKEINDYIEKNKANLPEGSKPEELKTSVKQQLEQQKLGDKFQTWIDTLQKNAKISSFIAY